MIFKKPNLQLMLWPREYINKEFLKIRLSICVLQNKFFKFPMTHIFIHLQQIGRFHFVTLNYNILEHKMEDKVTITKYKTNQRTKQFNFYTYRNEETMKRNYHLF